MKLLPFVRGAILLIAAFLCCPGCVPSTSRVINMRDETWAWKAKNNHENLINCFNADTAPSDPMGRLKTAAWKIEALRTLHHLDQRFDYRAAEPALHAQLIELTGNEYRHPSCLADQDQLRAWAVYLLGQASPQPPPAYFVQVLLENSPPADPQYAVCLAALNALYPQVDSLAADKILRQQMLYRLAEISIDLDRESFDAQRRDDLVLATNWFQQQLKSYPAIVDLLQTASAASAASTASDDDLQPLLEILKWNYQQLKVEAHSSADALAHGGNNAGLDDELFRRNCNALAALSGHGDADVRSRARLILAEFAPECLFDLLVQRISGDKMTVPEDHQQLVALILDLDERQDANAAGRDALYSRRRSGALDILFASLSDVALQRRELIYGQLLAHAPNDLADGLISRNNQAWNEFESYALQHLRYLEHLRTAPAHGDRINAQRCDNAVAAFMQHPALAVKKQVAASLAKRNLIGFAQCCATAIARMDKYPVPTPAAAQYLLEAYMQTVAEIEAAGLTKELRKAMGEGDAYALLAHGMARPEMAVKLKIAHFLSTRNCPLLIEIIAADLNLRASRGTAIDSRQWCLLGDLARQCRAKLDDDSLDVIFSTLDKGLASADAEQQMLCARYLLELGCDPKTIRGNAEAMAMADMARQTPPAKTDDNQSAETRSDDDHGNDENGE